jgi:5-methylcytosine-specific restriction endonuclease McrA
MTMKKKIKAELSDLDIFAVHAQEQERDRSRPKRRRFRRPTLSKRRRQYRRYLDSDEWKERRDKILWRDNYECQKCGSTVRLQVHHLEYADKFGDEPDDALLTLCRNCHRQIHTK